MAKKEGFLDDADQWRELLRLLLDDYFRERSSRKLFLEEFPKRYTRVFRRSTPKKVVDPGSLARGELHTALLEDVGKLAFVAGFTVGRPEGLPARLQKKRYERLIEDGVRATDIIWAALAGETAFSSRKLAGEAGRAALAELSAAPQMPEEKPAARPREDAGKKVADLTAGLSAMRVRHEKEVREKDKVIAQLRRSITGLQRQVQEMKDKLSEAVHEEEAAEVEQAEAEQAASDAKRQQQKAERQLIGLQRRVERDAAYIEELLRRIGRRQSDIDEMRQRLVRSEDPMERFAEVEEMVNDAIVRLMDNEEIEAVALHDLTGIFVAVKRARPLLSRILAPPSPGQEEALVEGTRVAVEAVEAGGGKDAADADEARQLALERSRNYINYYIGRLTAKKPDRILVDGHNLIFRPGEVGFSPGQEREGRAWLFSVVEEAAGLLDTTLKVFFDTKYGKENPEYGNNYQIIYAPRKVDGEAYGADGVIIDELNGIEDGVTIVVTNDRSHIVPEVVKRRRETGLPFFSIPVDNLYFLFREITRRRELEG